MIHSLSLIHHFISTTSTLPKTEIFTRTTNRILIRRLQIKIGKLFIETLCKKHPQPALLYSNLLMVKVKRIHFHSSESGSQQGKLPKKSIFKTNRNAIINSKPLPIKCLQLAEDIAPHVEFLPSLVLSF